MCNKGGEDAVHELLPCTSIMRDWNKPQAVGTFPVRVPQLSRVNLGAGIAPFGDGQMPPWQSSEKCWVWDLLPLFRCWRRISSSWINLGGFPKLCRGHCWRHSVRHMQPWHTALLWGEQNPITQAGSCPLGFAFTSQPPDIPTDFLHHVSHNAHIHPGMLRLLRWSLIGTTWDAGASSANSSSCKLWTGFSFRFHICPMFYPSGEFVIPN